MYPEAPWWLEKFSRSKHEDEVEDPEWMPKFEAALYSMLKSKTKGRAKDLVKAVPRPKGLEAWR
eukprot:5300652-Karenia_brevis.AAC.1